MQGVDCRIDADAAKAADSEYADAVTVYVGLEHKEINSCSVRSADGNGGSFLIISAR